MHGHLKLYKNGNILYFVYWGKSSISPTALFQSVAAYFWPSDYCGTLGYNMTNSDTLLLNPDYRRFGCLLLSHSRSQNGATRDNNTLCKNTLL